MSSEDIQEPMSSEDIQELMRLDNGKNTTSRHSKLREILDNIRPIEQRPSSSFVTRIKQLKDKKIVGNNLRQMILDDKYEPMISDDEASKILASFVRK